MKKRISNFLVILFLLITVTSVEQWSTISLSPTLTFFLIRTFAFTVVILLAYKFFKNPLDKDKGWAIKLFLIWIVITGIRSIYGAHGVKQWTFFLTYFPAMIAMISIYYLDNFILFKKINYYWFRFAPVLFVLWFPFMSSDGAGFFLPLMLLHLLFIEALPGKSKFVLLFLTFLILIISYRVGARSHLIKFGVALLLGATLYFKSAFFYLGAIKKVKNVFLFAPILFLLLAITSVFNVFEMQDYISGDYAIENTNQNGTSSNASLTDDTRTVLYYEAIISAIKNNYVVFGRSFSRGYDSYFEVSRQNFLKGTSDEGTAERVSEVSIVNIFTWMGIVGVIIYFLVFVKATNLAIYHSNNIYIKIVGLYVAFRWMYGWVEDFQRLDISTLTLWMLLSLCFSKTFRKLNNYQIKYYFKTIFIK